jgi:hypothetical protein
VCLVLFSLKLPIIDLINIKINPCTVYLPQYAHTLISKNVQYLKYCKMPYFSDLKIQINVNKYKKKKMVLLPPL